MFDIKNETDYPKLISPKYLFRTIGFLGVSLPIVLIIGTWVVSECHQIQNSISAYYHTSLGNLFVGIICAMALCFWAYEGYGRVDRIFGVLVAIFAFCVAMFPTSVGPPYTDCLNADVTNGVIGRIHLACAILMFLGLAFFSLFLFTKSKVGEIIDRDKRRRNRIYKACGVAIITFMILIGIYWLWLDEVYSSLSKFKPVFWLEALCLWAFGISWFTKGRLFSPKKVNNLTEKHETGEL